MVSRSALDVLKREATILDVGRFVPGTMFYGFGYASDDPTLFVVVASLPVPSSGNLRLVILDSNHERLFVQSYCPSQGRYYVVKV